LKKHKKARKRKLLAILATTEMRAISFLNNQGVDLLRRGSLKQAADTLQLAIDLAMLSSMQYPTSANTTAEGNSI